jgi:two-component system, sensor histidine kinase and response regulator
VKTIAMVRFHSLGPWIAASSCIVALDLVLGASWSICTLQVVLQLASFRWLGASRARTLTLVLIGATILPGVLGVVLSLPVVSGTPVDMSVRWLGPLRLWVVLALSVASFFQSDLQRVRKRRLELRRKLQRKVRRRSAQITRINDALRREVARRQATQHRLTRTETHLQSLAQRMQLQVLRKDNEGVITYANDAFCKGVERSVDDVIGSTDFDLYPEATAKKYRADDAHVMQSGMPVDHVESHPTADGKTGWVQVFKAPEYDEKGDCIGIQMVFWDVTDTYRRTAELRRSEARKRALFDASREAVMLVDDQGRIVEANPSAESLLGGGPASLAGCLLESVALPDSPIAPVTDDEGDAPLRSRQEDNAKAVRPLVKRAPMRWSELPTSERREMTVRRHDGTEFPAEISVHPIPLENSHGLAVFVRDVTLRHRAIRALREAKRVAEEASRTKSEFMAGVSHEVRTPLGGITGSAALLAMMELPPRAKQYVQMIQQSADLLAGVIGDILDFAAIEAGRYHIDPAPTDLHQCVGEAFRCLATRAAGKDIELVLSIAPNVPRQVLVDAKRLRQIVINLAGNAIKFTPRGYVLLRMSVKPAEGQQAAKGEEPTEAVVIEMVDSGIGIAKELQQKIFEPFEQGDSGTTRRYGGTGLGLSICAQLVKHMGGSLAVTSRPGHGSTFRCSLPLPVLASNAVAESKPTQAHSRESVAVNIKTQVQRLAITELLQANGYRIDKDAPLKVIDHTSTKQTTSAGSLTATDGAQRVIWLARADEVVATSVSPDQVVLFKPVLPDDLLQALGASTTSTESTRSLETSPIGRAAQPVPATRSDENHEPASSTKLSGTQGVSLLLVDDSAVNRTVIHDFLEIAGFSCDVVASGAEAIVAASKRSYDCVLMDLQMPEMDGVETMHLIARRCNVLGRTMPPVVALTAHATQEHRTRCLEAGMKAFLVKPIDPKKLVDAVSSVTGKPTSPSLSSAQHPDKNEASELPWQEKLLAASGGDHTTMQATGSPTTRRTSKVVVRRRDWCTAIPASHRPKGSPEPLPLNNECSRNTTPAISKPIPEQNAP